MKINSIDRQREQIQRQDSNSFSYYLTRVFDIQLDHDDDLCWTEFDESIVTAFLRINCTDESIHSMTIEMRRIDVVRHVNTIFQHDEMLRLLRELMLIYLSSHWYSWLMIHHRWHVRRFDLVVDSGLKWAWWKWKMNERSHAILREHSEEEVDSIDWIWR